MDLLDMEAQSIARLRLKVLEYHAVFTASFIYPFNHFIYIPFCLRDLMVNFKRFGDWYRRKLGKIL